jgi:hypothetical protein
MTAPWVVVVVLLALVVALNATVTLGVLRRAIVVLDRASIPAFDVGGLRLLTQVPPILLRDHTGAAVQFPDVLDEPAVVVLMESSCGPCRGLAKGLSRRAPSSHVPVIAILDDSAAAREFPLPADLPVFYGERTEITAAFATAATPYAIAVDESGRVLGQGVPGSTADINNMARHQKGGETIHLSAVSTLTSGGTK